MLEDIRLSRAILLILSLSNFISFALAEDSTLNAFLDADCKDQPQNAQNGTDNGVCQQISTQDVISVSVGYLGRGCTINIYSDKYCSFDAFSIKAGYCFTTGAYIESFSVDGCSSRDEIPSTVTAVRSTPLATSTGTSTPASSSASGSQKSGASHSTVIGLAVGMSLLFVIVVGAALWFVYKRRRKAKGEADLAPSGGTGDPIELPASYPQKYPLPPLPPGAPTRMKSIYELPTPRGVVELDAEPRYDSAEGNKIFIEEHPEPTKSIVPMQRTDSMALSEEMDRMGPIERTDTMERTDTLEQIIPIERMDTMERIDAIERKDKPEKIEPHHDHNA